MSNYPQFVAMKAQPSAPLNWVVMQGEKIIGFHTRQDHAEEAASFYNRIAEEATAELRQQLETQATDNGYYRQIAKEALRIINEIHETKETSFDSKWLAKANAFMNDDDEEIIPATLEEVAQYEAEYQAHLTQVTLNSNEIDILAQSKLTNRSNENAFSRTLGFPMMMPVWSNFGTYYSLRAEYNTPANHAAIANRRKELLGE